MRIRRYGWGLLAMLAIGTAQSADGPVARDAWARATPPGTDVGAVYFTIDGGATEDRLVSADTARARMTHLHDVSHEGDVARMRSVEHVTVPANGKVTLAPQGLHLMLMGLGSPLAVGETFRVSLKFEVAGPQDVVVTVRAATEPAPSAPHHH